MKALIVVDAQSEFSPTGLRPVPNHADAIAAIRRHLAAARAARAPIAWVRHHNRPHESRAFVPGSWGAQLSRELDPNFDSDLERLFEKDVYGAFTGTELEAWLRARGATHVAVVGFFAHMCLSTTVREALVRGFEVVVDPDATGARAIEHPLLGSQTADEVRRSALLQVADMGATIAQLGGTRTDDAPRPYAAAMTGR
jgi:nicotinamidase-related amidase